MDDKAKIIENALASINKKFGDGSVMRFNDGPLPDVQVISTGAFSLDMATGIGGIPRGRITEIYGPPSGGKTTLALMAIRNAQKDGLVAAYVDAENAFDAHYAERLGLDLSKLIFNQPQSGEEALEITESLVRAGVDIIVVDSVALLVPSAEIDNDMGKLVMGGQARLMKHAMRKLTGPVSEMNSTLVFINHVTMKIGIVYGDPRTTPGGSALGFSSSLRIQLNSPKEFEDSKGRRGIKVASKVTKNKLSSPGKEANFEIIFGIGIDWPNSVVEYACDNNYFESSGNWWTFDGQKFNGRNQLEAYLLRNPELFDRLVETIRETVKTGARDGNV